MDKYSQTLNSKISKLKNTIDYMQKDIDQIQLTVSLLVYVIIQFLDYAWNSVTQ